MASESGYESNPLGQPAVRRDVPCVDGSELARRIFTQQGLVGAALRRGELAATAPMSELGQKRRFRHVRA
jgi:hypothetical protein